MKTRQHLLQAASTLARSSGVKYVESVASKFGFEQTLKRGYYKILSQFCPSEYTITVRNETLSFKIDGYNEYRVFQLYPEREPSYPVLPDIVDELRSDDVFWDIGANVGIYTCFGATSIESGEVVSIEPNPKNVERIEENLSKNGLAASTYQYGLMDTPGTLSLNVQDPGTTGSYGHVTDSSAEEGVTVDVSTGDTLVREGVPEPNVVKLDVQGVEFEVLRGIEQTIACDNCRTIYYNVNDENETMPDIDPNIHEWLEERGFTVETVWEWTLGDYQGAYRRAKRE